MHSDAPLERDRVQSVGPDLELLELVAQGGMASVYRARQTSLDRIVAVKVIDGYRTSKPMVERFGREARLASRLQHPHVVSIFGHGITTSGSLWISMELLEGQTLAELLQTEGALSAFRAVRIIRQVLTGLAAAHQAGVLHRDLKPSNVFLCRPAGFKEDHAKLLDFGLAIRETNPEAITAEDHVVGTVGYMSPEQSTGQPVDARSDLYSVGVLLHEMLFGRTTRPARASRIHEAVPAGLPQLPSALVALLDTLVAFRPDDRPASVFQVIDALDRIDVGNQGTGVPKTTVAYSNRSRPPRLGWMVAVIAPIAAIAWYGGATYGSTPNEPPKTPAPPALVPLTAAQVPSANPGTAATETKRAVDTTSAEPRRALRKNAKSPPSKASSSTRKRRRRPSIRRRSTVAAARPCKDGITIESMPTSATVIVKGRAIGRTPHRLPAPNTPIEVAFEAPGFLRQTATVKDRAPCRLRVRLTVRDPTVPTP